MIDADPNLFAARRLVADTAGQRGEIHILNLSRGLTLKQALLHTETRLLRQHPGCFDTDVRMVFVLEGRTHLQFDGCEIELQAGTERAGVFLPINRPEEGRKIFYRGRQHELVLFCSSMWLEASGCPPGLIRMIRRSHLVPHYFALTPAIHAQLLKLQQSRNLPESWRGLHQQAQSVMLVAEVLQALFPGGWPGHDADSLQEKRLQKLLALLHDADSEPLTLEELARLCHSNTTTLQADFQTAYGLSIARYRREYRLYRARDALRRQATVAEAALLAGYRNPECFSKAFKRYFGRSPSKY